MFSEYVKVDRVPYFVGPLFFILQISPEMVAIHVVPYAVVILTGKSLVVYGNGALLERYVVACLTGFQGATCSIPRGKQVCLYIQCCRDRETPCKVRVLVSFYPTVRKFALD